jgi:hypothetical protein
LSFETSVAHCVADGSVARGASVVYAFDGVDVGEGVADPVADAVGDELGLAVGDGEATAPATVTLMAEVAIMTLLVL